MRWLFAAVLAAALCVPATASAHGPDVNVALAGSSDAQAAIDGDAATTWCGSALRVDLGRPKRLTGLGLTLGAGSATPSMTLETSLDGRSWRSAADNRIFAAGEPEYVRFTGPARFVRLRAESEACVGELRAFAPDRATRRMALGADISFTPLEEAAGN